MIPPVMLDHFMVTFLFNCVALEHCFLACGDHITTYIVLMGCLMKEKEDPSFICNKGIIDNLFGSDEEASRFFKDISKSVKLESSSCNLRFMFESINGYTSRRSIGCNYFGSPWVVALTIGAVVLLLVAIAQLVVACLSFGHDLRH
ncbi:hypothetical protein V5N11_033744 [Cardamine amara subsp. amara]|uniref:Uncharacterized protein n=1 Tax=Cardamine amara subsp. amara TaxID=228776 RepID=A0ABD1BHZ1_CARAN